MQIRRRNRVLAKMYHLKYISKKQYLEAIKTEMAVRPLSSENKTTAPYFVEYVRRQVVRKYGQKLFLRGGLSIQTTLDLRMQSIAEQAISKTLNRPADPSAALIALDPKTGVIKAMVGGRDFRSSEFNLAIQGRRQAGSSFKTFVLVTALRQGISPKTTFSGASPITIRLPKPGPDWRVKNYGNKSYGSLPITEATIHSVNVVFAQLIMKVGAGNVARTAKEMGIESPIDVLPAIALGGLTHGVSVLDMASAYATLANDGKHVKPISISSITDYRGRKLFQAKPEEKQVLDREVARQANAILQEVINRGTGRRAKISRPSAGKTGTSEDLCDAWFIGYTPNLVTAVWVGYSSKRVPMRNIHGISVVGGSFPAQIWHLFMSKALEGMPVVSFAAPKKQKKTATAYSPALTYRKPKQSYQQPPPQEDQPAPVESQPTAVSTVDSGQNQPSNESDTPPTTPPAQPPSSPENNSPPETSPTP